MTRFYTKELPESPIYIQGRPFRFDFMATEDGWLISEFSNAIAQGIGGIVEITKEQYDESIKKKSESPSQPSFQRRSEIIPSPFNHAPAARPAVVVGSNIPGQRPLPSMGGAEPIVVTPPKVFLPSVGKNPK